MSEPLKLTIEGFTGELHYLTHDCQICNDPEPPYLHLLEIRYVVAGESKEASLRCCGKCRGRIEAGEDLGSLLAPPLPG